MGERQFPKDTEERAGATSGAIEETYAAALERERRKRSELERHVQKLAEENRRNRAAAEERDLQSRIRDALQERGVKKADLAMRVIEGDVGKDDQGALYGEVEGSRVPLDEYVARFVAENPEFLPPRISGGAGIPATDGGSILGGPIQMDDIRPGMSADEASKAWKEVARLMGQRDPLG